MFSRVAAIAAGPTPPAFAGHMALDPCPYDPAKPSRCLKGRHFKRQADLLCHAGRIRNAGSGGNGTAIRADLAAVGFDVEIETW